MSLEYRSLRTKVREQMSGEPKSGEQMSLSRKFALSWHLSCVIILYLEGKNSKKYVKGKHTVHRDAKWSIYVWWGYTKSITMVAQWYSKFSIPKTWNQRLLVLCFIIFPGLRVFLPESTVDRDENWFSRENGSFMY